ncbi:Farnesylcysteine lyase [Acorus calamus]|uniref:Farnesylcysteine lyase n=1 Tax=Acorus calamus TaxID=4465 RepID=A0AAV9C5L6_ACOCL|nr:Farnesylcysteine lyase [Acorus calamus]
MELPPPSLPSPPPPPFLLTLALALVAASAATTQVCIIGSGIAGSSLSHFLHHHRPPSAVAAIHSSIFEISPSVGGRMSTVSIAGAVFESGASIIHHMNLHASSFVETLNLTPQSKDSSSSSSYFGVWDGRRFVFRSLPPPSESDWSLYRRFLHPIVDDLRIFWRYGFSLLRMRVFVGNMLRRFMRYYEGVEDRPVFESVEEMLRWSGLYGLTQRTLREELVDVELSERFISELVTAYFGFTLASEVPDLVGTVESPDLPFSCVAVQKKISEDDKVYKIFSRSPLEDNLLDKIFSTRKETIRINWAAYPHFEAPEVFAPFVLDDFHLYYINAFENAASTIETGAVAAENVARLILSRLHNQSPDVQELRIPTSEEEKLHLDL